MFLYECCNQNMEIWRRKVKKFIASVQKSIWFLFLGSKKVFMWLFSNLEWKATTLWNSLSDSWKILYKTVQMSRAISKKGAGLLSHCWIQEYISVLTVVAYTSFLNVYWHWKLIAVYDDCAVSIRPYSSSGCQKSVLLATIGPVCIILHLFNCIE